MYKNYLNIAFRHFRRQPGYTFIMVVGLTIGIASSIFVAQYIQEGKSFDRFHDKSERIYRVTQSKSHQGQESHLPMVSTSFAPAVIENFPSIEQAVQLAFTAPVRLNVGENYVIHEGSETWYTRSNLFETFSFPWLKGNPAKSLSEPYSIVLTTSLADQLFGNEEAIGQTLGFHVFGRNHQELKVTGLVEDVPGNSHLSFQCLISYATLEAIHPEKYLKSNNWESQDIYTYLLLNKKGMSLKIESEFNRFVQKYTNTTFASNNKFYLQPLRDIHLHSDHLDSDRAITGDLKTILILFFIALGILIVAIINYVNLATAKSSRRHQEIGIRKSLGATRHQLMVQFLTESILLAIIALGFGLIFVEFLQPFYNSFVGKEFYLDYKNEWYVLACLALGIGLFSGIYPAFYLSSIKPVKAFKGKAFISGTNKYLRRTLVTLQFAIASLLVVAAGTVWSQIEHINQKDLGLEKDQVVYTVIPSNRSSGNEIFSEELLSHPNIYKVGRSVVRPLYDMHGSLPSVPSLVEIEGNLTHPETPLRKMEIGHGFCDVFDIKILEGRSFSKDIDSDLSQSFLINQTAVKSIGLKSPKEAIGISIYYEGTKGKIIGVVEDFNFESLHSPILPFVMVFNKHSPMVFIKIAGEGTQATIASIQQIWEKHSTTVEPFHYTFMSEFYNKAYSQENKLQSLLSLFSILAITISCLGALGLMAFVVEERKKEIGIRKVLGASVSSITKMLSIDLIKLVSIAFIVSAPIAIFLMGKWLNNFIYKVEIQLWIFVFAGALILSISFLTIIFQSVKAALANPIDSIRTD